MRVIFKDCLGNTMLQECESLTAVTDATSNDDIMLNDFGIDTNCDDFDGVEGIHMVPFTENGQEMFIACTGAESIILSHASASVIDLSMYKSYDAGDWEMY